MVRRRSAISGSPRAASSCFARSWISLTSTTERWEFCTISVVLPDSSSVKYTSRPIIKATSRATDPRDTNTGQASALGAVELGAPRRRLGDQKGFTLVPCRGGWRQMARSILRSEGCDPSSYLLRLQGGDRPAQLGKGERLWADSGSTQ